MVVVRPVILSGGAGTRLWPLSRRNYPKQLLPIAGAASMLQETAARVADPGFAEPIVVGNEEHRHFIKRQLEEAGITAAALLLEPAQRNTASAAALAAEWSLAQGGDEILLVMPSDHVIAAPDAFVAAVRSGISGAVEGGIITFGIPPSEPNTEYGYIETGEPAGDSLMRIARFVEKPDAETAVTYFNSKRFYWNSGIFMFRAESYLQELGSHLPKTRDAIARAFAASEPDGLFTRPDAAAFLEAENISIDYAVMEKTRLGFVIPVEMGWSDVGSWNALWKVSAKDENDNVVRGEVSTLDTRNSFIRAEGPARIAAIGLSDTVVIATRDAILVAPMAKSDEIKQLVADLESQGLECAKTPAKVARPWGSYESLDEGQRFQIKHIVVAPGERLSLQMHYHRSEHWVVVSGTAEVTVGEKVFLLQENESTYIPAGTTHRLCNPGKVPLELVEVQCGPYLGEDDIVRLDDEYGRQ